MPECRYCDQQIQRWLFDEHVRGCASDYLASTARRLSAERRCEKDEEYRSVVRQCAELGVPVPERKHVKRRRHEARVRRR